MAPRRKATGGSSEPNQGKPTQENGFYYIEGADDDEVGDFDWHPKDPGLDPPINQYRLSEDARSLYAWCVDNLPDDPLYNDSIIRLRKIVFAGLVSNPVVKDASKRLEQLNGDLLAWSSNQMRPHLLSSVKLRLLCLAITAISGLILICVPKPQFLILGNWLLLISAAAGSTAALTWYGQPPAELSAYGPALHKAKHHEIEFCLEIVLLLGASFIIQNKWITIALGGSPLDISGSTTGALAIGFILGLLSDKMMQMLSPLLDRISKAFSSTGPTVRQQKTRNLHASKSRL
jgi:hypothetical protein